MTGDPSVSSGRARKLAAVAVAFAAAATVVAGCGDASGSGVDDDKLVIYSGRQEALVKPIIDRFQEETGIEVSVRYGNTAQLAAQLIEEGTGTPADVFFSQDGGALGALGNKGRLEKLPEQVLSAVPAEYRADDGTWVGTSGRSRVIVYDPAEVPEAEVPDSVFELTDPKWKGKVGIAPSNASFESFVTGIRVLSGDDAAAKWLAGMKANDVKTFDNNILILDAVKDGVLPLGLINHYYWYEQVAEEGEDKMTARLKFLPGGDPGALVNVAGAGVLKGSDKAEQARRFVEFMLEPEAQKFFAEHTKEYPLVAGVQPVDDLPALDSLQTPDIDLSDLDTLEQTIAMIQDAGLT
jgi:iron(III) transport system substrate-binding protein